MTKVILNVIFVIYAIIAVLVTICLLSYNQFRVTEFGVYSLLIIDSDDLNPEYQKGDLVIVEKADIIRVGEKAFFYNTYQSEIQIKLEDVLLGKWITTEGTADDTARIYDFYKSGILDSYIGNLSGTPSTGCYEIENDLIYMNPLERTNPKAYNIVFTVVSFSDTEIVVQIDDKTITWKKYE